MSEPLIYLILVIIGVWLYWCLCEGGLRLERRLPLMGINHVDHLISFIIGSDIFCLNQDLLDLRI